MKQIVDMRESLDMAWKLAKEALGRSQGYQKERYDHRVKPWGFQLGQSILVLLPTESAKLFTKWQGPYEVTRKISDVDYEVHMEDKKKKLQVLHVNLLKLWVDRKALFGDLGHGARA